MLVVPKVSNNGPQSKHLIRFDRGLHDGGAAHDRDLAAALQRDRAAEWSPGGSAR